MLEGVGSGLFFVTWRAGISEFLGGAIMVELPP